MGISESLEEKSLGTRSEKSCAEPRAKCPSCGEDVDGRNKVVKDSTGVLLFHEECAMHERWWECLRG